MPLPTASKASKAGKKTNRLEVNQSLTTEKGRSPNPSKAKNQPKGGPAETVKGAGIGAGALKRSKKDLSDLDLLFARVSDSKRKAEEDAKVTN